jgi:hypothetical protein
MQTQEANMSKGDQLRAFFTENPDAATVAAAKQFDCNPGYVSAIKKGMGLNRQYQARKKSVKKVKKGKSVTHTNGVFKNGAGWGGESQILSGAGWLEHAKAALVSPEVTTTPEPLKHSVPLSPWADYGLWMDRDSLKGFLRGRAVEYLTKGDKLSIEEALRCVTKLAELTGE